MTEQELLAALSFVEHPSINATLVDLGILKSYKVENGILYASFTFPFPKIPIKDTLIGSVQILALSFGFGFEYSERVMNEAEKSHFLSIEHANWKDGSKPMC